MNEVCFWIEHPEPGAWQAECNKKVFYLIEGTPKENGFEFCPYCGRELKENIPEIKDRSDSIEFDDGMD